MRLNILIGLIEISGQLNFRLVDHISILVKVLSQGKTESEAANSLSDVFLFQMIDDLRHGVSLFSVSSKLAIIV